MKKDIVDEAPPEYSNDEPLPNYQSSLQYFGMSLMKTEFVSPYHCNEKNRSWKPVFLELNSTQLKIYSLNVSKSLESLIVSLYKEQNQLDELAEEVKRYLSDIKKTTSHSLVDEDQVYGDGPCFDVLQDSLKQTKTSKLKMKWKINKSKSLIAKALPEHYESLSKNKMLFEATSSSSIFEGLKCKGRLIESYTLSNSTIGEAPSLYHLISSIYKEDNKELEIWNDSNLIRFKNTLRVRLEMKQILFQFWSFHGMVHWYRNIFIGRDLSHPLDQRTVSKIKSIPSRNSIRKNASLTATATTAISSDEIDFHESESCSSELAKTYYISDSNDSFSATSTDNSVFSNDFERRPSSESLAEENYDTDSRYSIVKNKFSFVSYERYYNNLEKQFISNCIPDLNAYDKWMGVNITLSNYSDFLNVEQARDFKSKDGLIDLFIDSTRLNHNSKKKHSHHGIKKDICKDFLIEQRGLVSLVGI